MLGAFLKLITILFTGLVLIAFFSFNGLTILNSQAFTTTGILLLFFYILSYSFLAKS